MDLSDISSSDGLSPRFFILQPERWKKQRKHDKILHPNFCRKRASVGSLVAAEKAERPVQRNRSHLYNRGICFIPGFYAGLLSHLAPKS